jgi:hypothetical protein
MDDPIKILILVLGIFAIIVIAMIIFNSRLNKKVHNAMFESVYNVLKNIQNNIDGNSTIIRNNSKTHDFYFETQNKRYFIKIVYNPGNHEICVNNALKWQIRKSVTEDRMHFVDGIEPLMRMEIEPSHKEGKKLYIIYPNTKSLLKYINECEMIFIHPNTDVYGTNIVTFTDFEEKFNEFEF